MQNTPQLLTKLARIAAALGAVSFFAFWVASRRGEFLGLEPQHFVWDALLFVVLALYLRLDGFFAAREARRPQAVEEVVEVHTGEVAAVAPEALTPGLQPAWRNPTVLSAAIIGGALLVAGVLLSGRSPAGDKLAAVPAAPVPAQAPQAPPQAPQAPAAGQKVAAVFGDTPILNKNAKVQMIEFGDFQCPFCGRFFSDTFPQIKKQYLDTGKIAYQHRDYPLPFHQYAQKSHEAARCALEQSEAKYWQMHDWLYANQNTLDVPSLKNAAKSLGLKSAQFDQCLDGGKYADAVKKDYDTGSGYGVSGTPSFFINGQLVVGAQPLASFTSVIDAELAKAGK